MIGDKKNKKMKTIVLIALFATTVILPVNISGHKTDNLQNSKDNVYILTDENFSKSIKSGIVLVDFWATWCGPCKILGPIIDDIALDMGKKVKIGKLDTDRNRLTSLKYDIKYLPTLIIFKNGTPEKRIVGLQSKETIVNAINEML